MSDSISCYLTGNPCSSILSMEASTLYNVRFFLVGLILWYAYIGIKWLCWFVSNVNSKQLPKRSNSFWNIFYKWWDYLFRWFGSLVFVGMLTELYEVAILTKDELKTRFFNYFSVVRVLKWVSVLLNSISTKLILCSVKFLVL